MTSGQTITLPDLAKWIVNNRRLVGYTWDPSPGVGAGWKLRILSQFIAPPFWHNNTRIYLPHYDRRYWAFRGDETFQMEDAAKIATIFSDEARAKEIAYNIERSRERNA